MKHMDWNTLLICLLPLISIFLFQYLLKFKIVKKILPVKAVDLTVLVLFYSIAQLSKELFEVSFFAYFIVALLCVGILLLLFLAKKNGEIIYKKFFKTYWRMNFLLSSAVYLVLVIMYFIKK
ncbi:DUF3397 domain-containing protein [Isobaculum melis]|uniref:DUF3397 domain-containing protein n=1 Tax=Isobaculum melis TaxID=142588 RepID=A0A1H9T7S9_9LACT|nr:DUF3397 domain-containing protein [Isobaculum melis]SER93014.1 Protein of unknown function [Isobaculum melis]